MARVREPPAEARESLPVSRWFEPPRNGFHDVTNDDLAYEADREYEAWRRIDNEHVQHACDMSTKITEWILSRTREELARAIEQTPSGCRSADGSIVFEATPFQRLLVYVWCNLPVTCSSTINISRENMEAIQTTRCARRMPIRAHATLLEGSFIDAGVNDGPTGSGKTFTSLAIAGLAVGRRFEELVSRYRCKQIDEAYHGTPSLEVARIVVVATASTVRAHFETTFAQMKPELERLGQCRFHVWTAVGKSTSLRIAAELPEGEAVVWFVPIKKFTEIRRECPEVAIAIAILDEFTVDTPRERFASLRSPLVKCIIPQATPSYLSSASNGRSFLTDIFGSTCTRRRRSHW